MRCARACGAGCSRSSSCSPPASWSSTRVGAHFAFRDARELRGRPEDRRPDRVHGRDHLRPGAVRDPLPRRGPGRLPDPRRRARRRRVRAASAADRAPARPARPCCCRGSRARPAISAAYVLVVYLIALLITGIAGDWWPDHVVGPGLGLAAGVVVISRDLAPGVGLPDRDRAGDRRPDDLRRRSHRRAAGPDRATRSDSHALKSIAKVATWALPFEALYQAGLHALVSEHHRPHRARSSSSARSAARRRAGLGARRLVGGIRRAGDRRSPSPPSRAATSETGRARRAAAPRLRARGRHARSPGPSASPRTPSWSRRARARSGCGGSSPSGIDEASNREAIAAAEAARGRVRLRRAPPERRRGIRRRGGGATSRSLRAHERVVAIGETGLDYYRDSAHRDEQRPRSRRRSRSPGAPRCRW